MGGRDRRDRPDDGRAAAAEGQVSLWSTTAPPPAAPDPGPRPSEPAEPHYKGHRQRLKHRFETAGPEAFPDYELLELLLFSVLPQRDTKPLAKELIARFGSLAEVLNAPDNRLREVKGIGPGVITHLKVVRAAGLRLVKAQIQNKPVLGSWQTVIDYCRAAQGFEPREQFRLLFLDKRNQLIADEVQQRGTVDHTPVYVREVVKRALELGATALILVHNHPSGDPTPSRADIDMTRLVVDAAKPIGIVVHDHIIVGRNGHASFKALKLM